MQQSLSEVFAPLEVGVVFIYASYRIFEGFLYFPDTYFLPREKGVHRLIHLFVAVCDVFRWSFRRPLYRNQPLSLIFAVFFLESFLLTSVLPKSVYIVSVVIFKFTEFFSLNFRNELFNTSSLCTLHCSSDCCPDWAGINGDAYHVFVICPYLNKLFRWRRDLKI